MNQNIKLKLIDGIFEHDDAKEILLNLFTTKINFHKLKNFSSQERFGIEDESSNKRIAELKMEYDKLAQLLKQIKLTDHNLRINTYVDITICNQELIEQ